jgi:hypothetical protein
MFARLVAEAAPTARRRTPPEPIKAKVMHGPVYRDSCEGQSGEEEAAAR